MKNTISFETAVRLKKAGFPQPAPEVGQFWHNKAGQSFVVLGKDEVVAVSCAYLEKFSLPFSVDAATFDKYVFAPTATDILEQLFPAKGRIVDVGAMDILRMALDPERAALVWIERNKK